MSNRRGDGQSVPSAKAANTSACNNFAKTGFCKFGSSCRYSHYSQTATPDPTPSAVINANINNSSVKAKVEKVDHPGLSCTPHVASFIIEQRIRHCPRSSYETAGDAANKVYMVWESQSTQGDDFCQFSAEFSAIISPEFRTCANCYLSSEGAEGGKALSSSQIIIRSETQFVSSSSASKDGTALDDPVGGSATNIASKLNRNVVVYNHSGLLNTSDFICMEILLECLERKQTPLLIINNFDDSLLYWLERKVALGNPVSFTRESLPSIGGYYCGTVLLKRTYSTSDRHESKIANNTGFNGQPSVQSQRQFKFLWDRATKDDDKCKYRVLLRIFFCPEGLGDVNSVLREVIVPTSRGNSSSVGSSYSKKVFENRLTLDDWDEIITALVRLDYSDYEIYSFIRQVFFTKGLLASDSLPRCVFETIDFEQQKKDDEARRVKTAASTSNNKEMAKGKHEGAVASGGGNEKSDANATKEPDKGDGRSNFLLDQIISTIPRSFSNKKFMSALDFGCAEGSITAVLGEKLKIPVEKMFGADVREIPSPGFTFVLINTPSDEAKAADSASSSSNPTAILPSVRSGSIDLVNASMVFHHIQTVKQSLVELRRVISPGGLLLIREHHCNSPEMGAFLDIVHGLYSLCFSSPVEWPNFVDEYEAYYRSQDEWNQLLLEAGFKRYIPNSKEEKAAHFLYTKAAYPLQDFDYRSPKVPNPIRAYHAVYTPMDVKPPSSITAIQNPRANHNFHVAQRSNFSGGGGGGGECTRNGLAASGFDEKSTGNKSETNSSPSKLTGAWRGGGNNSSNSNNSNNSNSSNSSSVSNSSSKSSNNPSPQAVTQSQIRVASREVPDSSGVKPPNAAAPPASSSSTVAAGSDSGSAVYKPVTSGAWRSKANAGNSGDTSKNSEKVVSPQVSQQISSQVSATATVTTTANAMTSSTPPTSAATSLPTTSLSTAIAATTTTTTADLKSQTPTPQVTTAATTSSAGPTSSLNASARSFVPGARKAPDIASKGGGL